MKIIFAEFVDQLNIVFVFSLKTLFNPNGTVVKMFVVRYDLTDMPPNSRTFVRQRTLFMPSDANEHHVDSRKWLRYLIHLRLVIVFK